MICDASKRLNLHENDPFHRTVWQGPMSRMLSRPSSKVSSPEYSAFYYVTAKRGDLVCGDTMSGTSRAVNYVPACSTTTDIALTLF